MKWDSLRKTARDNKVKKYARAHKDLSQEEIAAHFGLTRVNVNRILHKPDPVKGG